MDCNILMAPSIASLACPSRSLRAIDAGNMVSPLWEIYVACVSLIGVYVLLMLVAGANRRRNHWRRKFSRRSLQRRSMWMITVSNSFAVAAIVVILQGMLWDATASNLGNDSPWDGITFWISHLTPPVYALPYILRAARLAALYDSGLRVRRPYCVSSL